jgi:hypothetical protein
MVVRLTFKTCSTTFSSQSLSTRPASSPMAESSASYFFITSCTCRSQLSIKPNSRSFKAARTPPQP